jgi:hypothetical protein
LAPGIWRRCGSRTSPATTRVYSRWCGPPRASRPVLAERSGGDDRASTGPGAFS